MLIARNITKKIGGVRILKDVSLELKPGEVMCIIGPSGAGKTSLLRALSLLDYPDSGEIAIDSDNYRFPVDQTLLPKSPYPVLTVVFQQLFMWPHLTIRENILLPVRSNIDHAHFNYLAALFKMKDFLDRYPNEVSIGQRQRAALVRALLLKPKYLLLDEVTSALDIEQSQLILGHLKEIAAAGVGAVCVTHAFHFAKKVADTIIFMDNGGVVEQGPARMLTDPSTRRLREFMRAAQTV